MSKLLKNLYTKEYVQNLANEILKIFPIFKKEEFINNVFNKEWDNKELKQRMRHISLVLGLYLPKDYKYAINILIQVYNGLDKLYLENMIFQDFVEVYGLDDFDISMKALEYFTINSSSEFAIRQFIVKYETKTINQMIIWAKSENEHIRRLASEGCRSRLPWAIALIKYKKDPSNILKILEILIDDKSKYVQKSVANNLNDISKDNPDIVKNIVKKYIGQSENTNWILKYGSRTLLKQGDLDILDLFGYYPPKNIIIQNIKISKEVFLGENLDFSFSLKSKNNLGKLRLEYAIIFVRLHNKFTKKVFKIKENLYNCKILDIKKQYSFKKITTRQYYEGVHKIEFIVNGVSLYEGNFNLKKEKNVSSVF